MENLKSKCENFIKAANITATQFFQQIGLSRQGYYNIINGNVLPYDETIQKIINYLNSEDAQRLIDEGRNYSPTTECASRTGMDINKIRKLCTSGKVHAKQKTPGGRWLVNNEDLNRYIQKEHPSQVSPPWKTKEQKLVFGSMHSNFDVVWNPLLSCNNDYEIFDLNRHEYDYRYWISNVGQIYNTATGEILATNSVREPYVGINLKKDGKNVTRYIHRLVAYCFCPNGKYKDIVHHIDGNKENNRADNLLWVTYAEHKKCHELMDAKKKPEYKKYIGQLLKDNQW